MLDEMTSKFAIFLEYENPWFFFHFSFRANLFFPQTNALVNVNIDHTRAFIREKYKGARNGKKIYMYFRIPKIWQFWSISSGHFVKHKPLTSEEWYPRFSILMDCIWCRRIWMWGIYLLLRFIFQAIEESSSPVQCTSQQQQKTTSELIRSIKVKKKKNTLAKLYYRVMRYLSVYHHTN